MKIKKMLDYIYPPRCPVCDKISSSGICGPCRKKIVPVRDEYCMKCGKPLTDVRDEYCPDCRRKKHSFDAGRSLFSYQGGIRSSLYRLKYSNKREYADVYGKEMAERLGRWIRQMNVALIVPVPLHPSRKRERGYNQAALLARELGRCTGIPVEESLLIRTRKTAPLKLMTGQERRRNLHGAFKVQKAIAPGTNILLVDDIYTTGSTVDAAAACLKSAGRCRVFVATVAIGG